MNHAELPSEPHFRERPTAPIVPDAYALGAVPLLAAPVAAALGWSWLAVAFGGLCVFVLAFFRNPDRALPADPEAVVAPADGRVLAVDEIETRDGRKVLRIGIFLSVFNVHVNRAPVAGRVVAREPGGQRFLAAFNARGEQENVRLALDLDLADGRRVRVVQITGLIARRIVCHPQVGEWVERGARYGLIRFGSRTDVWLPAEAVALVAVGDRVRGGATAIARLGAR